MKKIKKISLVGLGAIGSAYGSYLHQAAPNCLQVIANKERIERFKTNGCIVNGKNYDFNYIQPEVETIPSDLIIVSVKYHHLAQAIEDMRNHVGPETIILSLMNGISTEEIIGREYGMEKLLYSYSVAIDAIREGNHTRYTNIGKIVFGEKNNTSLSPRVNAVKELFENAKIPYEIPEDMLRSLWWKFMINVGINQTSAVLRAPYGVFQQMKEANGLMRLTMEEAICLANRLEIDLRKEDIDSFQEVLHTLSPNGKTSMLQDIEAGRKTEVEIFAGTISELGQKHGVATPANDILKRIIHAMEQINAENEKRGQC
ncbi:ketopantoate reductase family protein [Petroclostridium sp. X23]|uniref:ketopantoate reductase family protein n=1 Tax=Petroclostridium sp. X23 TaxID=3045146 RepID=UPI0024AD89F6|nr:ketopantoate reductase family protein [Petroclostridium sp. X23]WHH58802.1 ketopantoate reductase family protein [Petroclostridium sp. X23]